MTLNAGNFSLRAVTSTNTAGRTVQLGEDTYRAVAFAITFPGAASGGTTKCSVRAQVQLGSGSTRWTSIGAAATTAKSTQGGVLLTSTSATPFNRCRLLLITRTTGSGAGVDAVSGSIYGVR
jgi:hypothetical protein